ncbi:hypothetical protein AM1_0092 [Acaryochloris marina MBIC11017]|uniref:Uncharacterized protein n=1 Tax=Acaryochloris marina (strain MBIC 11017) TaxID=329726 RepID=B0C686_ACAM1|nr:hypothetical protein AM1_0092 [Acaryochloris marina MBIC11017]
MIDLESKKLALPSTYYAPLQQVFSSSHQFDLSSLDAIGNTCDRNTDLEL